MRTLIACLILACAAPLAHAATHDVTLDGVQPGGGPLVVLVFERADGFPKETCASRRLVLPAGQTALTLDRLAPGPIALMAYHDENVNGELDRFLGMIPKEGWDLSNNPSVSGKPAFGDAAVVVPETGTRITIKLNY